MHIKLTLQNLTFRMSIANLLSYSTVEYHCSVDQVWCRCEEVTIEPAWHTLKFFILTPYRWLTGLLLFYPDRQHCTTLPSTPKRFFAAFLIRVMFFFMPWVFHGTLKCTTWRQFFCVASWPFRFTDAHSQHGFLHKESSPCFFRIFSFLSIIELSAWPLFISWK